MPNGDRMCAAIRNTVILTSDLPGRAVGRIPEIDLATHDKADEIVWTAILP